MPAALTAIAATHPNTTATNFLFAIRSSRGRLLLTLSPRAANFVRLCWAYYTRSAPRRLWRRPFHGPEEDRCPRRATTQPEKHQPRNTAQHADGDYRLVRIGKILPGVRHDLRRGPAPLRGISF